MPVTTYTFGLPGEEMVVSKKLKLLIEKHLKQLIKYCDEAQKILTATQNGMPGMMSPAVPYGNDAKQVKSWVDRNEDLCKLLMPKATTANLTKPGGAAMAAPAA